MSPRLSAGELLTRALAATGLGYDAYAHFDLASRFDANAAVISQGTLFRIEAILAVLAALGVLLTRWRAAMVFGLLVALSALGAVLLYRYVDVGVLGPLPNMYEPAWYPEKTLSAVAEALAALALGAHCVAARRRA